MYHIAFYTKFTSFIMWQFEGTDKYGNDIKCKEIYENGELKVKCIVHGKEKTVVHTFIPRNPETEKLYDIETQKNKKIEEAATEWGKIEGIDDKWGINIPTQLYDTLNSWEKASAIAASITYLHEHGII